MASLTLRPLRPEDIDAAYALVRLGRPALALDDWRARAGRLLAQAADPAVRGVMTARRKDGRAADAICGLIAYAVVSPLASPPALHIEHVAAFDLTEPERVARMLIEAVIARTGCKADQVVIRPGDDIDPIARLLMSPAVALHQVL